MRTNTKRVVSDRTKRRRKAAARAKVVAIPTIDRAKTIVEDAEGKVVGLTDDGLRLVESLASCGNFQDSIAVTLGLTPSIWRRLMGKAKDETPLYIAWWRGWSFWAQVNADRTVKAGKRFTPAQIHYNKSKLDWREGDKVVTTNENRIQITLAAPTSKEEMFRRLGIEGPLDFRKDKSVPLKEINPAQPQQALPAPLPKMLKLAPTAGVQETVPSSSSGSERTRISKTSAEARKNNQLPPPDGFGPWDPDEFYIVPDSEAFTTER